MIIIEKKISNEGYTPARRQEAGYSAGQTQDVRVKDFLYAFRRCRSVSVYEVGPDQYLVENAKLAISTDIVLRDRAGFLFGFPVRSITRVIKYGEKAFEILAGGREFRFELD
jgi:hypothetical protein